MGIALTKGFRSNGGTSDFRLRAAANTALLEKLVAPGSAKFRGTDVVGRTKSGRFALVFLAVDSQNGFGALLRTYATVVLSCDADGNAHALLVDTYKDAPKVFTVKETAIIVGKDEEWVWTDWPN